jgi:hypothetical protein
LERIIHTHYYEKKLDNPTFIPIAISSSFDTIRSIWDASFLTRGTSQNTNCPG